MKNKQKDYSKNKGREAIGNKKRRKEQFCSSKGAKK